MARIPHRSPLFFVLFLSLLSSTAFGAHYILESPDGRILARNQSHEPAPPASTLKLLTSLVALNTLGPDHRIPTHWGRDVAGRLVIRGMGDPLLLSGCLRAIAQTIARTEKDRPFTGMVVDVSFFPVRPKIPGVAASSLQPYDAPLDAFAVNFSTVSFCKKKDRWESGEPETPLIAQALPFIRQSGLPSGRIPIPSENDAHIRYGAALIRHFLMEEKVSFTGSDILVSRSPWPMTPIVTTPSAFSVRDAVQRLLRYSNNFTANLLLFVSAKKAYPALSAREGGIRLLYETARDLGVTKAVFVEGSGISRDNQISPEQLLRIVKAFSPHRELLREGKMDWYKTGTLKGIRTRAGFIKGKQGLYPYVLFAHEDPAKWEETLKRLVSIAEKEPSL